MAVQFAPLVASGFVPVGSGGGGGVSSLNALTGAVVLTSTGATITITKVGNNINLEGTGSGSATFTSITSGTNITAAMVVGTGASLATSGTGTIVATSVAANGVGTTAIANSAVTYAKLQNESASTLLGNPTGGSAAPSEITLGTGLSFSGSVLNAIGGGAGITWNNVTGTTQSAAANNGYITNNASLVTVTLPATAAIGNIVAITGSGAGGWAMAQNSGQTIHFGVGNTTTGTGGSLSSTNRYDCIELICVATNTDWVVRNCFGSVTFI